jgi:ABC-type cobalamin/Fe3+-siderophores transport system ATPase subunit
VTPQPLTERALAHPYLAPAAAVAALWSGGLPLHGGAFVADGSAWVVLGAATSGKSTLLACLARQGVPVLSDDLAVVRDGAVAVGARCIDLRADAARTLGCGEPLGFVGKRERWRMTLPPAPASAPLGGFVALDWGDATGAREADPSERLRALAANLAVVAGSPDVETLLDLAARPMVRIERARRLDRLDAIASLVLNRVTQRKF